MKGLPHPPRGIDDITNVFEVRKLNFVPGSERNSPTQAYGIDVLLRPEINNDPLLVQAVVVAGEMLVKIRIALPERVGIAIIEARVAVIFCLVDSAATTGKVVTMGDQYRLSRVVI